MKKLNIAIIGLGNIGSYLFNYLNKNKKILSKKNNCVPNVLFVSAKNKVNLIFQCYLILTIEFSI